MEDYETVKTHVKNYLVKNYREDRDSDIFEITLDKLDGLSNTNYVVNVINKNTSELILQLVYRKFGEISEVVDRDLETTILNNLADKGIGPKILERDLINKKYRLDEYLANTTPIAKEDQFNSSVLDQMNTITNSYCLISYIYKYKITQDNGFKIDFNPYGTKGLGNTGYKIKQNMFNMCMKDMYTKAYQSFEVFAAQFKEHYSRDKDTALYEKFDKFDHYMKNYHDLFMKVWPKEGFLVLNHNDVHRLNLIVRKEDKKIFILDHEYASLNLIGNDLANYMNESNFNYSPEYYFDPSTIDFDFYYENYMKYLDEFCKIHVSFVQSIEGRFYIEKMRTKKYYINLHCVLNLFWLLYAGIYLNFPTEFLEGVSWSYFQHGIDRIEYYERAMKRMEEEQ